MGLMERVSTLVRANLNDLIDKAEHPEKMIKQLMLDMENQMMQVKTQVAVAIADQHMLEQKEAENNQAAAEWMRKAELAVDKKQDDLARVALERYQSSLRLAESFKEQVADQAAQVDNLKTAMRKLEQKLAEAQAKSQLLIAQHRRSRAVGKARDAQMAMDGQSKIAGFERMKQKVAREAAVSQAKTEMTADNLDDKFAMLEKEDEIERLLGEVKARRHANA
ncbi:MAG: PspA/IM30 family protein [Candidatus Acidiferrales bacterium]